MRHSIIPQFMLLSLESLDICTTQILPPKQYIHHTYFRLIFNLWEFEDNSITIYSLLLDLLIIELYRTNKKFRRQTQRCIIDPTYRDNLVIFGPRILERIIEPHIATYGHRVKLDYRLNYIEFIDHMIELNKKA